MALPDLFRALERFVPRRVIRFGLVGLSGVPVNLGVLALLSDVLHLDDKLSSAVAIEVSIVSNFLLNNAWTFRDRNELARVGFGSRLFRYNLVSLIGFAIQFGTFVLLTGAAVRSFGLAEPGLWKYPSQLVGIAIAMGWNFLSNFFWTWAQHKDPATGRASSMEGPT